MVHILLHSATLLSALTKSVSNASGMFFAFLRINFAERHIYLPKGRRILASGVASWMNSQEKTERLLKALGDKSRLQILECIQGDISNPGKIARNLNRHRSTIEKHLRVLLRAGIVEKTPSLTSQGNLSIKYKITENAAKLLAALKEACKEF
jgi:DNA-binding transcriptional ArsR family regulator